MTPPPSVPAAEPPISAVRPEEHARLVEVWEAAVRATHHFLSEADVVALRALVRDRALAAVTLVAARDGDGRVLGFAGVAGDKLEMLFVDPAAHGRGVGRRLLAHAVAQLGARAVDVNEQNPRGVGFYRHVGAAVIGRSEVDGEGRPFPLLHLRLPAPADAAGQA
jgi:putative acetyltransferase